MERNGSRLTAAWTFVFDNSLLLIAGTVAALAWANLALPSYGRVAHSMHFIVNDIGMVFFFALATKEILEATQVGGALASPREAAVPLIAAAGGMVGPVVVYTILTHVMQRPEMSGGWAVPCATDIAFSFMAARLIFPRDHPAIPFLLLLAIADDALGLILLAVFYPSGPVSILMFTALMIPAIGVALALRRRRVRSFWPYLIAGGGLSWSAMYVGGLHPALALVPILPFMPRGEKDLGLFDPREHGLPDTLNRFEHFWKVPVQFVLMAFGLVNAGVPFGGMGSGTWIVFFALLLGKPIGILGATYLSVKAGLRAPGGLTYLHIAVVGVAAGIGFTVALFFATAAFAPGALLEEVKMGALFSFVALPVAVIFGRAVGLRSGRVAVQPSRAH